MQLRLHKPEGRATLTSIAVGPMGGGHPRYMPRAEVIQLRDALNQALGERFLTWDEVACELTRSEAMSLVKMLAARWGFNITATKRVVYDVDVQDVDADHHREGDDEEED